MYLQGIMNPIIWKQVNLCCVCVCVCVWWGGGCGMGNLVLPTQTNLTWSSNQIFLLNITLRLRLPNTPYLINLLAP